MYYYAQHTKCILCRPIWMQAELHACLHTYKHTSYIHKKRLQANIICTHSYTTRISISNPYNILPEREMNPQSLVAAKAKSG